MILSCGARLMVSVFLVTVVAIGGLASSTGPAMAQRAANSPSGQALLKSGLDAQKARNHAAAISLLSRAINSGALPRKQMTYALYRRAVSNRAQRQTAQAISDLNSALFFKGDLSSRDRADAIEERMRAFKDAGLQPTAVATASSAAQWAPSSTVPVATAQPPRSRVVSMAPRRVLEPIRVTKPAGSSAALPAGAPILAPSASETGTKTADRKIAPFQTRVASVANKPAPQSAPASSLLSFLTPKVERGVGVAKQRRGRQTVRTAPAPTASWQVATRAPPATVAPSTALPPKVSTTVKPAVQVAAVAKPEPTAANTGSGVGQFFSNFFGGNGSAPVTSRQMTGSLEQSPAAPKAKTAAKPVQVAAAEPVVAPRPSAPVSRPARPGKFEIEVARLRNKYRADALAKQLVVQYSSSSFWSTRQTARVQEKPAIGEEGPVYSVRYGVYSSESALSSMCDTFKADGLDCEPVRRK